MGEAEPSDYLEWLPKVVHTPDLDGGGPILAPIFASLLQGREFDTAFEWCAGPAWIGMWLLECGICRELVTGDINEDAVTAVRETSKANGYNVRSYISDNLKSIPARERFDVVVGNPPNYCNIQLSHQFGHLRNDLRPSDVDWKIHEDFYDNIGPYLHSDSVMYISEIDPYSKDVHLCDDLYDKRPQIPMNDFSAMTLRNELKISKAIPYDWFGEPDPNGVILEIVPWNRQ